jgi:hypothetical protein
MRMYIELLKDPKILFSAAVSLLGLAFFAWKIIGQFMIVLLGLAFILALVGYLIYNQE